jgi:hypothetical protein
VGLLLNDFSLFVVSRSFSQTVVDFDWFCLTYSYSVAPKDFSRSLRKSLYHLERSGEQGCLWEAVEFSFSVMGVLILHLTMPIFSSLLLDPTGHASTLASGVVEKPQEVDESFPLARQ